MEGLLDTLKETALSQGKRLLGSPHLIKIIARPSVMKVVMHSVTVAVKVRIHVQAGTMTALNRMGLGLQSEIDQLRRSVDSLECTVAELRAELDGKREATQKR